MAVKSGLPIFLKSFNIKNMARKRGITTLSEAVDSRETAIELGEHVKQRFRDLIPHRVDNNTVILIHAHQDPATQINRFLTKLEKDRKNY